MLAVTAAARADDRQILNDKRIHLGNADSPEWDEFAADPPTGKRFDVTFDADANAKEATLFIRQDDVKGEWPVELNGKRIGTLFKMEADLVHTLTIPAGALRRGRNLLAITPPKENDDIVLDKIVLDDRSPVDARSEAKVVVHVMDEENKALPCRITVVDEKGVLAPIIEASVDSGDDRVPLAVRPGVAYTANGLARIALPAGRYTVFASRGFEYGIAQQDVALHAGDSGEIHLRLIREVATPGLVSCDTHIHTFTHSGHGDATVDERMLTLAGEGIELPIATDHNFHADFAEPARRLGLQAYFTPVTGNEVTTRTGHFNIFPTNPTAPVPDFHLSDWSQLMAAIRATERVRVVILNHPRSIHDGFRPFDPANFNSVTGDNKRGPPFAFDALELLNSGAQQTDYLRVFNDWFALLNHGYRITAVGASDSHDVSRFIVGQARTYIAASDDDPSQINIAAACQSVLEGRALVSMGLLTQMKVDGKFGVGDLATGLSDEVSVEIKVSAPTWVNASHLALYANGIKIREQDLINNAPSVEKSGEKARVNWSIAKPAHDVYLVAIATGPAVTAPFWAMTKPYQPTSRHWEGRAIGSTNPIWLDADADGRFTAPRGYASRLIDRYGTDAARLVPALGDYDEATAAQAAGLYAEAGGDLRDPRFAKCLEAAAPQVAAGFARYIDSTANEQEPAPKSKVN